MAVLKAKVVEEPEMKDILNIRSIGLFLFLFGIFLAYPIIQLTGNGITTLGWVFIACAGLILISFIAILIQKKDFYQVFLQVLSQVE